MSEITILLPLRVGAEPSLTPEAMILKEGALALAADITKVDTENLDESNDALTTVKATINFAESGRKEATAPFKTLTKATDALVRLYLEPLEGEEVRLKKLMGTYVLSTQERQIKEASAGAALLTPLGMGAGIQARDRQEFEILNIKEAYLANPDLFELTPKRADIIRRLKDGEVFPFIRGYMEPLISVKA